MYLVKKEGLNVSLTCLSTTSLSLSTRPSHFSKHFSSSQVNRVSSTLGCAPVAPSGSLHTMKHSCESFLI